MVPYKSLISSGEPPVVLLGIRLYKCLSISILSCFIYTTFFEFIKVLLTYQNKDYKVSAYLKMIRGVL